VQEDSCKIILIKGYGGYFQGKWFSSSWPNDIPSPKDKNVSMAFLELYPIVVAEDQHDSLFI
jgi:hypothetical protein